MGMMPERSADAAQLARMDKLLRRHVIAPSGCWLWNGTKNQYGYGLICVGAWYSGKRTTVSAHRFMWERHNGPAPDRSHIMHTCDTRGCVNPGHLRLGSARDNVHDMISKGRQNFKMLRKRGDADAA